MDTSAILKFIVEEPESMALIRTPISKAFSSALSQLEVKRTLDRIGVAYSSEIREKLEGLTILELDRSVISIAETFVGLPQLKTLDSIHLASATLVKREIKALITYDKSMARSAETLGFAVSSPS